MENDGLQRLCTLIDEHFTRNADETECRGAVLALADRLAKETRSSRRAVLESCLDLARQNGMAEAVPFYLTHLLTRMRGARRRGGNISKPARATLAALNLNPGVMAGIGLRQNAGRGGLYEQIAANLVRGHLARRYGRTDISVEIHGKAVDCRDTDGGGQRFPDLLIPEFSMMIEVKSGYVRHSRFIREQIRKDAWLLSSGAMAEIWWFLFFGGSPALLDALDRAGIKTLDLGLADGS